MWEYEYSSLGALLRRRLSETAETTLSHYAQDVLRRTYIKPCGEIPLPSFPLKNVVLSRRSHNSEPSQMQSNLVAFTQNLIGKSDDLSQYVVEENMPAAIRAALERKRAKEQEDIADAVAQEIMDLAKTGQKELTRRVQNLRDIRGREKAMEADVKSLDRLLAYARATSNYLPLAADMGWLTGAQIREAGDLAKVPADWSTAQVQEASAQA